MIPTSSERTKRMSRYSVTVKIVQTWYEEIEVEACSEDGAEIVAELENVQPTGEPVVDRYVYCNWMVKDTEPTPDEYDAMTKSDEEAESTGSSEIDIDSVLDRPKRSRRRSRRSRSKAKSEIDTETQRLADGDSESTPVEVIIGDESIPSIEEVEVSETEPVVEAPPKRSRNRSRRSRSKARQMTEAEQAQGTVASENAVSVDDIIVIEELTPGIEAVETSIVEPAEEAPKKSRNRSRRSRSKARQTSEAEHAQVLTETAPEIIVIEETALDIEAVEASEVAPTLDAPQKPRSSSRRSRSKPRPTAEINQQQEVTATESAVIEEPMFVVNAMPALDAEPAVEVPKKPRSRSRGPQPKSQAVSEAEQPQETIIVSPEITAPVAPVVTATSIPDESSAEKPAAPIKKTTTRKRRAPKSSDAEQGPQIGDDSFLGSDE